MNTLQVNIVVSCMLVFPHPPIILKGMQLKVPMQQHYYWLRQGYHGNG